MPKDLSKEKFGSEPYKKKREIFTTSKIDFYIAMKGWQLNMYILENSLVNCFLTLDEHLGIIEILKKIQNDQNNQIVSIKEKLPMNRKHPAFKYLEVKFAKEKDFDKDGELNDDINIDISNFEKLIYNLENFVVNDSEKNYYCPDCKEYRYSEFHTCVSRYEFIFSQNAQEYNTAVKKFKDLSEYNLKYLSFLNSLDSIKKYGFSKKDDKDIKNTNLKLDEFRLDQFGKHFSIKHKEINDQIRNRIQFTRNPPDNNNRIQSTGNPPDNNNKIQSTRNPLDNNNRIQFTRNPPNNNRIQSTRNPLDNNNRIQSTRNLLNSNNRIQSTRNQLDNNNRIQSTENPPDNNNRIQSTRNPPNTNNRIQSTKNPPDNLIRKNKQIY
ncbi:13731_t:CDS:2 [Gigaspora margarita]|uniref:13731_t:CDS:1 n=1 Tax=Gigaspora margarita TaxID=4874 RepID=A0ABN7UUC4_GIGMA|nr:13731_t:CDS:2 [Gigaspora margarita]